MTGLPAVSASEVIAALERLGFRRARQRGSHVIVRHADGRWAPVPLHRGRDIDRGLLRSILRELSLPAEDFLRALRP